MRYIVVPIRALTPDEASPAVPSATPFAVATPEPVLDGWRPENSLGHWVAAARASLDACLVVDAGGTVAAVSTTAADLLGASPDHFVGRHLDEVLSLVGFTENANEARGAERRIPPLIAVRENSLSRGMMRIRHPDGQRLMLDAVAAPIHDGESRPIGAVSFLASV